MELRPSGLGCSGAPVVGALWRGGPLVGQSRRAHMFGVGYRVGDTAASGPDVKILNPCPFAFKSKQIENLGQLYLSNQTQDEFNLTKNRIEPFSSTWFPKQNTH